MIFLYILPEHPRLPPLKYSGDKFIPGIKINSAYLGILAFLILIFNSLSMLAIA